MPTLTQPNEWVNRVRELDELYIKLQIVTGFTVEQLLEMFAAGYTLKTPDYSKSFEEMASLAETTPSNEPLTLEQLCEMEGEPVWCQHIGDTTFASRWMIVDCEMNKCSSGKWELPFEDEPDDAYGRTWLAYRRPPEGEKGT